MGKGDTPVAELPATALLYHDDSYLRTFDATIVALETTPAAGSLALALDRTAFYPGGGGQMADRGTLTFSGRAWPLTGLRKEGDVVWHELAPDALAGSAEQPGSESTADGAARLGLVVGAPITGDLDWDFRYRMMRTHTALHLLCGLIFRDYGAQVTGGQMYPDRARMDFSMESFTPEVARAIAARVNAAIQEDHPIEVYRLPREDAMRIPDLIRTKVNLLPPEIAELRIVEIVGVDLQADGGTHVRSTREVGGVRVVKTENKGKQNKRMEIAIVDAE